MLNNQINSEKEVAKKNKYGIFIILTITSIVIFLANLGLPYIDEYRAVQGLFISFCLGCIVFLNNARKGDQYPRIIFTILVFLLFNIASTICSIDITQGDFLRNLTKIVYWGFAFYIAYIVARKNSISNAPYYLIISTLPCMMYFAYQSYLITKTDDILGINSIYYLLIYIPFVLVVRQVIVKYMVLFIIFIGIILSFKRTALIAATVSIALYYLVSLWNKHSISQLTEYSNTKYPQLEAQQTMGFSLNPRNKKQKITKISKMIQIILILFISYGIYTSTKNDALDYASKWTVRFENLKKDRGSGRDTIWKDLIEVQSKSDSLSWLVGHGFNKVIKVLDFSAHNDFLEVLYDYGLIGFSLYILFIFQLIQYSIKMHKKNLEIAAPFAASIGLFLTMSLFSHLIIYPTYFSFLTIFWGISIAQYENQVLNTNHNSERGLYEK